MSQALSTTVLSLAPAPVAVPILVPEGLRYLQSLARLDPDVISELAQQDESAILATRKQGDQLEEFGWRIKCACDAALWDHAANARRGPGQKDVDSVGVLAKVAKKAKEIGVTPKTIYRNAQVFRLMQQAVNINTGVNILETLDQYGYYNVALTAANPQQALAQFAEKKQNLTRFRPTDAKRLLQAQGQTRKAATLRAVETIRQKTGTLSARMAHIAHIDNSIAIIKAQIIPTCPDEDFKERVWDDLLLSLEDERQELLDEDAKEALTTAWGEGHHREDQMATATGLPLAEVSRLMGAMGTNLFMRIQSRDMAQRTEYQLWHKVGEPIDSALYMPSRR